jgi:tripartite-type tricarboxylate transporter receptor subunit TctC
MNLDLERRRALKLAGGVVASAAVAAPASAQAALPSGTLKILVGYPPGGGTDVMARIIAEKLKERLGQNVLIENRPGASGTLAGALLRDGPADGSVVMYVASAGTAAQKVTKKQMAYDLEKDLATVTLAGTLPTVYAVSSTIGVKTFAEYVEWLKKNPGKRNFGTTAMGSSTHFFGVEIGQAIGIPLEPVAYKGAGPLISDLSAGHAPAGCGGLTDFLTHHRADKMRILCVSSPKRAAAAPELPTISEVGFPKLSIEGYYGFFASAKVQPAVIDAWNRELRAVLETPEMRQRLLGVGLDVQTSTPKEFFDRQSRYIEMFTRSMKAAGHEPD